MERERTINRRTHRAIGVVAIASLAALAMTGCTPPRNDETASRAAKAYVQALADGQLETAYDLTAASVQPTNRDAIKNLAAPASRVRGIDILEETPRANGTTVYFKYTLDGKKLKDSVELTRVTVDGQKVWRIISQFPSLNLSHISAFGTPLVDGKEAASTAFVPLGVHTIDVDPQSAFVESSGRTTVTLTFGGAEWAEQRTPVRPTKKATASIKSAVTDRLKVCGTACTVSPGGDVAAADPAELTKAELPVIKIDPLKIDFDAVALDSYIAPIMATLRVQGASAQPADCTDACAIDDSAWKATEVTIEVGLSEEKVTRVAVVVKE